MTNKILLEIKIELSKDLTKEIKKLQKEKRSVDNYIHVTRNRAKKKLEKKKIKENVN